MVVIRKTFAVIELVEMEASSAWTILEIEPENIELHDIVITTRFITNSGWPCVVEENTFLERLMARILLWMADNIPETDNADACSGG